jgi:hypothetical protein
MLKKVLLVIGGFFLFKWLLNKDEDLFDVGGNMKDVLSDAMDKPFKKVEDAVDDIFK